MIGVLSKRRGRALRIPTTPRPASAFASAMTPTVRLSLNYCSWALVRDRFDDGGLSGASLDRPALQNLLDQVRARRIDIIVVYKVDRLTRSLADFAKLVELFDEHEVSFVS